MHFCHHFPHLKKVPLDKNPNGSKEDYQSLLSLMTPGYEQMYVVDFNAALMDWGNENFDRSQRIAEDIGREEFPLPLTKEELAFTTLTTYASNLENASLVNSFRTGEPREDCAIRPAGSGLMKEDGSNQGEAWCQMDYRFYYHITDENTMTVEERDHYLSQMINSVQTYWDQTDLDTLLTMSE